jgi:hypothetical protein
VKLDLRLDDTLWNVVDRYPLSVVFFVESGAPRSDWDRRLEKYLSSRNLTFRQFERELRNHLESAVRPDVEDCEALSCDPLPFCPEDSRIPLVPQTFEFLDSLLRTLIRWLSLLTTSPIRFLH